MQSRNPVEKKVEPKKNYCRKCMRTRMSYNFYSAVDELLDSNNLMSVCKDCINELYDLLYIDEQDLSRTILKMCRILNVKFDLEAISATEKHLETFKEKGHSVNGVFGVYKGKLIAVKRGKIGEISESDYTFYEPSSKTVEDIYTIDEGKTQEHLEQMWGKGLSMTDYEYLEAEFSQWKRTTKCDTHPEEVLIKQICYVQNDIRRKRLLDQSVSGDLKTLREMMKSGALTPAQQGNQKTSRGADTFGTWIKDVEKLTPAEWHSDQEKYRDMDGIDEDLKDIVRSIKNFMTDSRDFNTDQLEELSGLVPQDQNQILFSGKASDMQEGVVDNDESLQD
jgi:hypothetical protein